MGRTAGKPLTTAAPTSQERRGRLEIRLLGNLEATLDGKQLSLATPRKSLQVLAYLCLNRGAAVSREYLAYLLYPDDEEETARTKLRGTLRDLPRILPTPPELYVTIDSDKVGWNPEAEIWIDVEAFAEAAADRTRLPEAIELYRGDLLPEIYDEWLEIVRERLRNVYLRCLEDEASEARRNANFRLAIELIRRVLIIDPWREDLVRRTIAMRYESGDRAGALSEYRTFSKRLQEALGVAPMPETAALAARISRGEAPAAEPDEMERVLPAAQSALLPFVGRHSEMTRLLETWSRASRGFGASIFVGGETGIGKSRLVMEFSHAVEERGGRVLLGTTSSPEAVPYECVAEALRSALPLLGSLKPTVGLASVATLLPELQGRIDLPPLARLDSEGERTRLFESLFRCIADLAAARPLLLVLEDVHWAQASTIELLQFLLRRVIGLPVMVLLTYREEETPRLHALGRLRRQVRPATATLYLSALSVSEVEDLCAIVPEIRNQSAVALVAATQGNPLFLTHLVAEARDGTAATAPSSLQEAVEQRIGRLSSDARTVAEIAACIGDRFSHDALREVSAWEETSLTNALDELLDRRIIREASGSRLEYTFSHNQLQATIAGDIPAHDAAIRRHRIGRVLEELYPERFSELSALLAAHYECGHDIANATRCYLEAVRRSLSIGAVDEARTLCHRALELRVPIRERVELLLELVTIEARRGDPQSRSVALLELERADHELGDAAVHRQILLQRIDFAAATGDLEAQTAAVHALRNCSPEDDAASNASAKLVEANLELARGRLVEARAAGEASLASSRANGDDAAAARALCVLAKVEGFHGNVASAAILFDDAARLAVQAKDPVLELLAMSTGFPVSYQRRDFKQLRELAERCVELAVRLGDRHSEALALGRLGITLAAVDTHVAEARRIFTAATRTCEEIGDKVGTAAQLLNQAILETRLGFFDRATTYSVRAIEIFAQAGDERGRITGLSNLTYLKACTGEASAAREAGLRALEGAQERGLGHLEALILENLAMAEGAAGNFRRATELANESFEKRSDSQTEVWSAKTVADVAIWQARCGNLSAAQAAADRLLSDEDAVIRSDWPAYGFWAAAQIFHANGNATDAARALKRARSIMETTADALEPEDRASFLTLPFHRDIAHAVKSGEWPNPPR